MDEKVILKDFFEKNRYCFFIKATLWDKPEEKASKLNKKFNFYSKLYPEIVKILVTTTDDF